MVLRKSVAAVILAIVMVLLFERGASRKTHSNQCSSDNYKIEEYFDRCSLSTRCSTSDTSSRGCRNRCEDGLICCRMPKKGFRCLATECPELVKPQNGKVDITGNRTGDTAHFECNPRYILNGVNTQTCQKNGTWTDDSPTCESMPIDEYTLTQTDRLRANITREEREITMCIYGTIEMDRSDNYNFYQIGIADQLPILFGMDPVRFVYGLRGSDDALLTTMTQAVASRAPLIFAEPNLNCIVLTPTLIKWYSTGQVDGSNGGELEEIDSVELASPVGSILLPGRLDLLERFTFLSQGTVTVVNFWDSAMSLEEVRGIDHCTAQGNILAWPGGFTPTNDFTPETVLCSALQLP